MNISKIHVNKFGRLSDFEISFENSKNIIYGKNEQGKSTLMAFIRAMFYGMSGSSRKDISENPRKKYMTWGENEIGGFIEFSQNEKKYRIERSFGTTPAKDTIQIFDLAVNSSMPILRNKEPGEMFFQMTEDSFEKSVFIGQIGSVISQGRLSGNEIIQRLQNLVSSADESDSYNDVLNNITSAMEKIKSKGGKIGILDKIYANDIHLSDRKHLAIKVEEEKLNIKNSYENLLKQRDDVIVQTDSLKNKLKAINLKEQYDKVEAANVSYKNAESVYEAELEKLSELRTNSENLVSEEEYVLLENSIEEYVKYSNLKTEKEKEKQIYAKIVKDLEEKYEDENRGEIKSHAGKPLYLILSIIALAISFVIAYFTGMLILYYMGIIFFTIFIALFLSGCVKSKNALKKRAINRQDRQSQISEYKLKVSECEKEIEKSTDLMSDINFIIEGIYSKYNVYSREEIHRMYLSKGFNDEKSKSLQRVVSLSKEQSEKLKGEYFKLREEFEDEYRESGIDFESDMIFDEREKIISELEILKEILQELQSKITDLKYRLMHEFKNKEELSIVLEETNQNNIQRKFYEEEYRALGIARKLLVESFEEMQNSFGPLVNKKCAKILNEISCGKYEDIIVSKDFDIRVVENEKKTTRQWKYLSNGTADLVYFALRLAISEVFSKTENVVPLFLDDAFLQYDDERSKTALKFIEKYSEERNMQFFLFTCHKIFLDSAGEKTSIIYI